MEFAQINLPLGIAFFMLISCVNVYFLKSGHMEFAQINIPLGIALFMLISSAYKVDVRSRASSSTSTIRSVNVLSLTLRIAPMEV